MREERFASVFSISPCLFNCHCFFIYLITNCLAIIFTDITITPHKNLIVIKQNHIFYIRVILTVWFVHKLHRVLTSGEFYIPFWLEKIVFIIFWPFLISSENPF